MPARPRVGSTITAVPSGIYYAQISPEGGGDGFTIQE
jgi:hypothetical protein